MDGPLAVQTEIAGSISPVRNMRKAVSGQLISKHLQRGLEHRECLCMHAGHASQERRQHQVQSPHFVHHDSR
jgi:hypothetical protein